MSNGQPAGVTQNIATTENGAYDLTIPAVSLGFAPLKNAVNPNTGAAPTFYLPTRDELYKAAFYSPTAGAGSPGYYIFASQSDANPGNSRPGRR